MENGREKEIPHGESRGQDTRVVEHGEKELRQCGGLRGGVAWERREGG